MSRRDASMVNVAARLAADRLDDVAAGRVRDHRRRVAPTHAEILVPDDAPDRMRDRAALPDSEGPTLNEAGGGLMSPEERAALENPGNMYTHLRKLVIGAYYTTPEGEADLGHIHAEPIVGDYPGPTGEALDHIKGVMADLDLGWDDLPIGPPPYPDKVPYSFTMDDPA